MNRKTILITILFTAVGWYGCRKKDGLDSLNCASMDCCYTSSVKLIIETNCLSSGCHGSSSSNGNLSTYDGLLIRVNNGTLSKRVLERKDMPMGNSLSLEDQKKIKCWLESGAPKN